MNSISTRSRTLSIKLLILAGAFAISLAAFCGSASAATEIGTRCVAAGGAPSAAAVSTNSQSFVIPTNGVITKWGTHFVTTPTPYSVSLLILRGAATTWTITGVSGSSSAVTGPNEFATRVVVAAGDRIGMGGTPVYCPSPGDEIALGALVSQTVGSVITLPSLGNDLTPSVWASIEPDVDGDGFGDETQDLCPQSATFQTTCPIPNLSVSRLPSSTGFKAIVTTSVETTVQMNGSLKLPAKKGKKARTVKFKTKKLKAGPGKITALSLKWPRSLTKALDALDSDEKLLVKVSITADGIITDRVKTFKLRLNGRG